MPQYIINHSFLLGTKLSETHPKQTANTSNKIRKVFLMFCILSVQYILHLWCCASLQSLSMVRAGLVCPAHVIWNRLNRRRWSRSPIWPKRDLVPGPAPNCDRFLRFLSISTGANPGVSTVQATTGAPAISHYYLFSCLSLCLNQLPLSLHAFTSYVHHSDYSSRTVFVLRFRITLLNG